MRKKGFTLIELLAVIVILAVIALIAVPLILSLVNKSRLKAAEESALFYVDTIENMLMINNIENTDGKTYKVKEKKVIDENNEVILNLEIKGDTPYNGVTNEIKINSGFIETGNLRFNAYYVHYEMNMETKEFKTCTSQKGFLDKCDGTGEIKPSTPQPPKDDEEDIAPVELQVGQYVQMTPPKSSYTITSDMTGCEGTSDVATETECPAIQTINPSELNLWRILRVNEDGTYDMVSEYLSSTGVYFRGEVGFRKIIGTLNKIASQYADNKYVVKTRHMGFNGQVEELVGNLPSSLVDTLYTIDTDLVNSVYGTLRAFLVNDLENQATYWLASRAYTIGSSSDGSVGNRYRGVIVWNGEVNDTDLYVYSSSSKTWNYQKKYFIRPIVTITNKLVITKDNYI